MLPAQNIPARGRCFYPHSRGRMALRVISFKLLRHLSRPKENNEALTGAPNPRQYATAVSFINSLTLGSYTLSFPTERAGGSVGKNLAYSSLSPAKSLGLASSTCRSTTFSSF